MSDLVVTTGTYDPQALQRLSAIANDTNESIPGINLPKLKINYNEGSKYEKGVWVIGQKVENTEIVEEGLLVEGFIMLRDRGRYIYSTDEKFGFCKSPMFPDYATVHGNTFGNKCGKDCPYRAESSVPRCSCQKVVFGIAIVTNAEGKKEMIDCVYYANGTSYMPYVEYAKTLKTIVVDGKSYPFPMHGYVTTLSSTKEKNEKGRPYYVAKFDKASVLSEDDIVKLTEKLKKVDDIINGINNTVNVSDSQQTNVPVNFAQAETQTNDVPPADSPAVERAVQTKVMSLFEK